MCVVNEAREGRKTKVGLMIKTAEGCPQDLYFIPASVRVPFHR